jgi:ATP-dependent clp protease, ATP-binding subunit clpB
MKLSMRGECMIVKDEQIKILKIYIENIEELVEEDDVQAVLDSIDDIIVDNILKNDEEPDAEGIKLQKIYDEIYDQNESA